MAVALQVVLVSMVVLLIQIACIPVATLACRLRPEVYPNAEFRLAQPRRGTRVVFFDAFPRRFERSVADGDVELYLTERGDIAQRNGSIGLGTVHFRNGGYGRQVASCLQILCAGRQCHRQHSKSCK